MQKFILLLLLLVSCPTIFYAQENPSIVFNEKQEVLVNGQRIDNSTPITKIIELLGTPELIKEFPNGKKKYHYPKLGLAIQTYNEKVTMMGANYNWDGDKTFPETTYTGSFLIGKTAFAIDSKKNILDAIDFIKFESLYMELFVAKTENVIILIGFKEGKLTQVGFEFKPE